MTQKQHNILLFITDMQRADTIAALGNPVIKTPTWIGLFMKAPRLLTAIRLRPFVMLVLYSRMSALCDNPAFARSFELEIIAMSTARRLRHFFARLAG